MSEELTGQAALAAKSAAVRQNLRWAIWHAMNRHPQVCGVVSEERLDDCADAAMTEIMPVIDDFLGRLGALRSTNKDALAEIDRLNALPEKQDFASEDEQWFVFYGGEDPGNAASCDLHDDEAAAREMLQWVRSDYGSGVARRRVWFGHWEVEGVVYPTTGEAA